MNTLQERKPPTYLDGLPQNFEGASQDALEWLIVLRRLMQTGKLSSLYADLPEHTKRVDACIQELYKYLPKGIDLILLTSPEADKASNPKNRIAS